MKLNLGSGFKKENGYINIDANPSCKPDLVHDNLAKLPYENGTIDEIKMDAVFEHLWPWEQLPAIRHWYRLLKPGGKLVINWIPNFKEVARCYVEESEWPGMEKFNIELLSFTI